MRDPQAAWGRFRNPTHPGLHELTEKVARAIHESEHEGSRWDHDKERDQWLTVGSWMAAEAVVAILPLEFKMTVQAV